MPARRLSCQRADDIVGFVASELKDRNAIGLERPAGCMELLRQVSGHFAAIGFVSLIFDFLKGLGLQIEAAHALQAFRLLIAEGRRGHVKHGGEIFRRKIIAQFAQHIYEDVDCCCRQAGFVDMPRCRAMA